MLNEVKQYFETISKIENDTSAKRVKIEEDYQVHGDYDLMRDEGRVNYGRKRVDEKAARAELAKSSDPLVAWIAETTLADYPDQSQAILRELPVDSMGPLQEIAQDADWCGEWDSFVALAESAGVLPGQPRRTAEYRTLLRWFREHVTAGRGRNNELRTHLDALIAAEVAVAVAAATAPDAVADDQAAAK